MSGHARCTSTSSSTSTAAGGHRYDVVVVGGGAAGLSGALTLARARRSVLVVDAGEPRNARAGGVHTYLGREGTPPAQLLTDGRAEAQAYGAEFRTARVTALRRTDGGFGVVLDDGSAATARRLLLTVGLVDELPDVPGLAPRWGRDVLHCPYCHGWEIRDQPVGVLATGPLAVHQALLWRQWTDDLTLFLHTGPEPVEEEYEQLAARGVAVVDGEVTALQVTDDRLTGVELAGGRVIALRALVVASRPHVPDGLLHDLGLAASGWERGGHALGTHLAADPSGATAAPGVWVAGNVANPLETVIGAAAAGVRVGGALNLDLVTEETRRAVDLRRTPSPVRAEQELTARVVGDRRHGRAPDGTGLSRS